MRGSAKKAEPQRERVKKHVSRAPFPAFSRPLFLFSSTMSDQFGGLRSQLCQIALSSHRSWFLSSEGTTKGEKQQQSLSRTTLEFAVEPSLSRSPVPISKRCHNTIDLFSPPSLLSIFVFSFPQFLTDTTRYLLAVVRKCLAIK